MSDELRNKNVFGGKVVLSRVVAFLLMLPLAFGLSGVGTTNAMFNDTESSPGNLFVAAFLDFFLSENEFDTFIGKEALGGFSVASVAIQTPGSLDIQYAVNVEKISGDDDFCNGLLLEATKNGIEVHDGAVFSFSGATSTTFGTWEFEYDLPPSVTTIGHGDECDFDIVYSGWRADSTVELSGFDDEERIRFEFTSNMVVMNEMLPNPTGSDSQSGLLGEWVELYNNGDTDVDVAGWSISELSDPQGTPSENFYTISSSTPGVGEVTTSSGSTVLTSGGFLVVVFSASRLNNTGDTVTLYDGALDQIDQHQYLSGEAPEGKSIARIPDGIGAWVDPIPTPGGVNIDGEVLVVEVTGASGEELDTTPPIITINGNNPALIKVGSLYSDLGALVTDNVNDNLGISVEGADIDTTLPDTHIVSYTATDQALNTVTVTRMVVVYDPIFGIPVIEEEVEEIVETLAEPLVATRDDSSESIEEPEEPQNLIEQLVLEVVEVFEPVVEEPVVEEPVITATSTEEVVVEEQVVEEVVEEPVVEGLQTATSTEPVLLEDTATSTEPVLEVETATSTEPLILEGPVVPNATSTATTTEEIILTEPVEEPTEEQVEEPPVEEPVVEEPPIEEAVEPEPIVEEPTIVEDPVEEPPVEEPVEEPTAP